MDEKDSPQKVIDSYQKRQQVMPFLIGGLAILFVMIGVIILIVWLAGPNHPALSLFASATPTPTMTYTDTVTPSPTLTATITPLPTLTGTPTNTATPNAPFEYTVQQGDSCYGLAEKFNVELIVLLTINNFTDGCPIQPNQKIIIPYPGQKLPTDTPLPTDIARGTKIDYTIQPGDTIGSIASKFNADVEEIKKDNKITDANLIQVGDKLTIKVNMVTPTKTIMASSTPAPTGTMTPSTGELIIPTVP